MEPVASPPPVHIVSGLPRSGTSMMMAMLQAGGLELLTDNARGPDRDNPRGYFELEAVKELSRGQQVPWLERAHGKAVKVISRLLYELPASCHYNVIFMRRPLGEVMASQRQMVLERGGAVDGRQEARLAQVFADHLAEVEAWMAANEQMRSLVVDYPDVLSRPLEQAGIVADFLQLPLAADAMAAAVDPALYRQRHCAGSE